MTTRADLYSDNVAFELWCMGFGTKTVRVFMVVRVYYLWCMDVFPIWCTGLNPFCVTPLHLCNLCL